MKALKHAKSCKAVPRARSSISKAISAKICCNRSSLCDREFNACNEKGRTPHHQFLNLCRLLNGYNKNRCHEKLQEDPISPKRKKQRNHQLRASRTDFLSSDTKTPKRQTGLQSEIKNSPAEAFSRSLG